MTSQTATLPHTPKPRPRWALLAVVYGLAMFLLAQLTAGFLLVGMGVFLKNMSVSQASSWAQHSIAAQFGFVLVAELLTILGVFVYVRYAQRLHMRDIGLDKPHMRYLGWGLGGFAGYMLAYTLIAALIYNFVPSIDLEQKQQIGFEGAHTSSQLILVLLSLVVLAPLAEEILFRGFLYTSLRAVLRARYAVIITSILFAVGHLQFGSGAPLLWVAAVDTFVLSFVLCVIREKTGSIWAGVAVHMLKNFIAFAALFLAK